MSIRISDLVTTLLAWAAIICVVGGPSVLFYVALGTKRRRLAAAAPWLGVLGFTLFAALALAVVWAPGHPGKPAPGFALAAVLLSGVSTGLYYTAHRISSRKPGSRYMVVLKTLFRGLLVLGFVWLTVVVVLYVTAPSADRLQPE